MNFFKSIYTFFFIFFIFVGTIVLFLKIKHYYFFKDVKNNNKTLKKEKFVFISIPKSGTFLLLKLFGLLGIPGTDVYKEAQKSDFEIHRKLKIPTEMYPTLPKAIEKRRKLIPFVGNLFPDEIEAIKNRGGFVNLWHLPYAKVCEDFINQYSNTNLILIRDPRDQVVSMAFFIMNNYEQDKEVFNDVLFDLIDGKKRRYIHWGVMCVVYPYEWNLGVVDFYNNLYLPWTKSSSFYSIRFENIIGVQGGGTKEAQVNEIKGIYKYLGLEFSLEKINDAINKVFGETPTFRSGKIGSWKEYFTPEIKEAFKAVPGANELLIKLGYEKDDKW